jgi:predicted RNase H-like HicB family nuclease
MLLESQQALLVLLGEELDSLADTAYPELCAKNKTEEGRAWIERNVLADCSAHGISVQQALAQIESSLDGPAEDEIPGEEDFADVAEYQHEAAS